MSAALGLYRLQQVDSQLDQIQARLNAIQQTLENDAELRAATEHLAEADSKHKEAERDMKQSESEVEKQRIKIEQTEASLYGGNVHNPKELQDLQKDVVSLKKHVTTLEERELESMLVAESAQKELADAKEELERVQSRLSDQHRDLMLEREAHHKNAERLKSERLAVVSDIAGQALSLYDQLRQQRRGVAVTTIGENSCQACGTTLTQSQQQSARSTSQLFRCPTCGRVLYAN